MILAAVALSLVPLPVRDVDKDTAVRKSIAALLSEERVFLDWKYIPFYDLHITDPAKLTLYFGNHAHIGERVFTDLGLKPLPEDLDPFAGWATLPPEEQFFAKNAVVEVTYWDYGEDERSDSLHFNFIHGTLGAQFYRLTIVRNFWGVFVFYKCVGAS